MVSRASREDMANGAVKGLAKRRLASVVFVVPFKDPQDVLMATNIAPAVALRIVRSWLTQQDAAIAALSLRNGTHG